MMDLLAHASNLPQENLEGVVCPGTGGWGMMGRPMMGNSVFGYIPSLIVWVLVILVLIALLRFLWLKGSESTKTKK